MKALFKNSIALFVIFSFNSCVSQKISNNTNYDFQTECMGTELDGSLTLKSWGKGRRYIDASVQAKKKMLLEMLFSKVFQKELLPVAKTH
jgi:hypothetical protein